MESIKNYQSKNCICPSTYSSCNKGVVCMVLGSFLISFMTNNTGSNRIVTIIKGSGTSFTLSIVNPEYSLLVNTVLFVSVSTISNLKKKLLLKSGSYLSPELFEVFQTSRFA